MIHFKQALKEQFQSYYENQDGKEPDEYGFDAQSLFQCEIFFRFLYDEYFKVKTIGIENIPEHGRVILIGNHSGVLPMDAFMLYIAILNKHPHPRRVRFLVHKWLLQTPGAGEVIRRCGGVPATYKTACKLLLNDEIVFFYPEGTKGTGKPFSMRYRLDDFDPGFVKAAIETKTAIVPVTTIGGDEIFPLLGNLKSIARLMQAPYWPVTPFYPFFPFSISCMPLPVKMLIKIDKPIYLDYSEENLHNRHLRKDIARNIQYGVQKQLNELLKLRKSPFSDWDTSLIKQKLCDKANHHLAG